MKKIRKKYKLEESNQTGGILFQKLYLIIRKRNKPYDRQNGKIQISENGDLQNDSGLKTEERG